MGPVFADSVVFLEAAEASRKCSARVFSQVASPRSSWVVPVALCCLNAVALYCE